MALTTAKNFGDQVIISMGAPAEFTTFPLLDHALRFGSALAYQRYLRGDYGPISSTTAKAFRQAAAGIARGLVGGYYDVLTPVGWNGRAALQATFESAIDTNFATFAS